LNPDFIGQPATALVETLYELKADGIEPYMVTTDVRDGRYYTASVFYPATLGFADARAALNRLYRRYEVLSRLQDSEGAVWHVTDKQLAIQLLRKEDHIRMIYLQFQVPEEPAKGVKTPGGTGSDTATEGVCR